MDSTESGGTDLSLIGEVDEHDPARLVLAAGTVETDGRHHFHAPALDEVVHGSHLEDLNATVNGGFLDL